MRGQDRRRVRRALPAAVAGLLLLVLVAVIALSTVGRLGDRPGTGSAGPSTEAVPTPPAPAPAVAYDDRCAGDEPLAGTKPVLTGLVGIGGVGQAADLLQATTVNVGWDELQPEAGGPISRPNAIDAAVEAVKQQDGCRYLKVRVLSGTEAPDWVKQAGGGPVSMVNGYDGLSGTVPRFWTEASSQAYDDLQRSLAAVYDAEWRVQEVVVSACTTFYAEPLLRQAFDGTNAERLLDAGYTTELDRDCQRSSLRAHDVWRRTSSSYALNPYQVVGPKGSQLDPGITRELAITCRELLGERCVLANNSVRWPLLEGGYTEVYRTMDELGPPLAFQLASPSRVGDPVAAVAWAVDLGASSVEVVPGVASANARGLAELSAQMQETAPDPGPGSG